ncbi:bifunctional UDP-N-acetylglucosamine diphosphorylase/glucosamine-1-phosphate N-acetyltransferase GlmU [Pseudomonadales bacterium]|nr:bifunctional UDP-N-acetylglucosamine diphosphorylase/glucosamine-1-phosphate N-acetyltransferase GlmU [Pseudomonadales bacterium]MDB2646402.1 bifunctional UDP-N-acetylglucosamine diphosphorylase/glucosamine-1-phosphate N-acetyltransferase GlmU [Pseudomonadales bacterium]MDB9757036.1 bifunctional UDP-N-acetylglucosamine diphosphorylase/glucosamine-1-phosphate N-acetyltransferase GlmU [Pseudomonadales bacterium]
MQTNVIVLAAGKGTRMRSNRAKVLHCIGGLPMISHVLKASLALQPSSVGVVLGHQADAIENHIGDIDSRIVRIDQVDQKGTGHAVQVAVAGLPDSAVTLVVYGDVPLIQQQTLEAAIASAERGNVGLVTSVFADPAQLGRIVRGTDNAIQRIVEFKDATTQEQQICEINSGILAAPTSLLKGWLDQVEPNNQQGEYYLTDIIAMAVADGVAVDGIFATSPVEVIGVNDRVQLAELERAYQQQQVHALMLAGVSFADPQRVDIRGNLTVGRDCFIDINTVFEGEVILADNVHIGPNSIISDSVLGDGVYVKPNTLVEGAVVEKACELGPFARIRPGTELGVGVKIGNFVEVKKSKLARGVKAGHLAYLGDATIGAECNIGAGTVTCNYDGTNKHPTLIGKNVFVGTNSTLVAPLNIGDEAFIAAGSTITKTVENSDLAVGRGKQRNISGWTSPAKRDN